MVAFWRGLIVVVVREGLGVSARYGGCGFGSDVLKWFCALVPRSSLFSFFLFFFSSRFFCRKGCWYEARG